MQTVTGWFSGKTKSSLTSLIRAFQVRIKKAVAQQKITYSELEIECFNWTRSRDLYQFTVSEIGLSCYCRWVWGYFRLLLEGTNERRNVRIWPSLTIPKHPVSARFRSTFAFTLSPRNMFHLHNDVPGVWSLGFEPHRNDSPFHMQCEEICKENWFRLLWPFFIYQIPLLLYGLVKKQCVLFTAVEYQTTVLEAIAEYHKHTCLTFVMRTNEPNWLLFVHKKG